MKKRRSLISVVISVMLVLVLLAGCGGNGGQQQTPPPTPPANGENGETGEADQHFTIGVINLMEHMALDAAFRGFVSALADNGFVDGDNITIIYANALGDMPTLSTIADQHVNRNVDMILSITTPATQMMANATSTIPILGTAVTRYVVAVIIDSNERPGGNVSGTSEMIPVSAQVDLVIDLVPDAQTIGLIYNSGEANSVLQVELAKERIEALGLEWVEVTVVTPADVITAMQSLVGRVDAIYVPACNTMASAMPAVHSVALDAGIPVVAGERNMVMAGALATMGIDYYELGYATGLMAIDVLVHGANPAEMPIQFAPDVYDITINGLVAEEIGFTVPDRFLPYVVFPED